MEFTHFTFYTIHKFLDVCGNYSSKEPYRRYVKSLSVAAVNMTDLHSPIVQVHLPNQHTTLILQQTHSSFFLVFFSFILLGPFPFLGFILPSILILVFSFRTRSIKYQNIGPWISQPYYNSDLYAHQFAVMSISRIALTVCERYN